MEKDFYVPSASLGKDQWQSEASREVAPPKAVDAHPYAELIEQLSAIRKGQTLVDCAFLTVAELCHQAASALRALQAERCEWTKRYDLLGHHAISIQQQRNKLDIEFTEEVKEHAITKARAQAAETPHPLPLSGDIGELVEARTWNEDRGSFSLGMVPRYMTMERDELIAALQSQAAEIEFQRYRAKSAEEGWQQDIASWQADAARIAELEKERDEALAANRGLVRLNEAVEARANAAESRLKDAEKVIEPIGKALEEIISIQPQLPLITCLRRAKEIASGALAELPRAFLNTGGDNG